MIYDAYINGEMVNSSDVGSSTYSTFRLPSGDVQRNSIWKDSDFGFLTLPVTFRATYNSDKVQIMNLVGYSFFDYLNRRATGEFQLSSAPEGNYTYTSETPRIERSLVWRGSYYFELPKKWSMNIDPSFTYSHNHSTSRYSTDVPDSKPINNDARENNYDLNIVASATKSFNSNHALNFDVHGSTYIANVNYLGDSPYDTKFSNTYLSGKVGYNFHLGKFRGWADAGVACEFMKTDDVKYNDPYPFAHLSATYSPNSKNQISLWMQYATFSSGVSSRSVNVIQENELLYVTGNPHQKNARHASCNLSYTFMPNNKFSATVYGNYFAVYDRPVAIYELYKDDTALIRRFENNGDSYSTTIGASLSLRLLDNRLMISASPSITFHRSTGYYDVSKNPFNVSLYAAYYAGNFNFGGFYNSREHSLDATTVGYRTSRSNYYIFGGWSKNDWNLQLFVMNFATNNKTNSWTDINSPLYSSHSVVYNGNTRLAVMV